MFYLPKPLSLLKKFGRERLTLQDFMALAKLCGIEIVLSPEVAKGYYYFNGETGKHIIVLSINIPQAERRQVAWHEFAHFLQNYYAPQPMAAFYCSRDNRTLREKQADSFAFVCVTGVQLCGRLDFLETLMTGKDIEKYR